MTLYKTLRVNLFEPQEQIHKQKFLTIYRFLVDTLIRMKNSKCELNHLVSIVISHKARCSNERCKCKIFQGIPKNILDSNTETSSWIITSIGFLVESTLINVNVYSNHKYSILLSDYYNHVKNNPLFGFSVIQNFISLNSKSITFRQVNDCYGTKVLYEKYFEQKLKNSPTVLNYQKLFNSISERFEFNKVIINYCQVYESLIDSKINFENSLKFTYDPDNGDLLSLTCVYLNKKNVKKIIQNLKTLGKLINKIKKDSVKFSSMKTAEYFYLVYLFYYIFKGKIPKKIRKNFGVLGIGESFANINEMEVGRKLEVYLEKYFSGSSSNQIIIKFSKGIKIKYFSANLCNMLGYNQNKIIGEDFSTIFPKAMRESHTKAMLHYLMYQNNLFYHGSTLIFTQKENAVPCHVSSASLPHFGKTLLIISEVRVKESDKKYILLDNNFSAISICKKLEDQYFFNLSLLKKCDTEITEIFDVSPKLIQKNFEESYSLVPKIQSELKVNIIDKLSSFLFNGSYKELNQFEKNLEIEINSLSVNNSNGFSFDASLLKSNEKRQKYFFSRDREVIIQKIIRAFNKITDSNLREEKFNKISQLVPVFKHSLTNLDKTISKLSTIQHPSRNYRNSAIYPINMIGRQKSPSSLAKIQFKITMRVLYDMPIFIVIMKDTEKKKKKPSGFESSNIYKERKDNPQIPQKPVSQFTPYDNSNQASGGNPRMDEENNEMAKSSKENLKKKKTFYHIPVYLSNSQIKFINDKRTKKNVLIYKKILFIIALLLVALGGFIFSVGIKRISESETIINFYFRTFFQRDKLTSLESFLLSIAYQLRGYSTMDFDREEMGTRLAYHGAIQEEALISFYEALRKYNQEYNSTTIELLQKKGFVKVIKNWEKISFTSDYLSEINYIIFLINLSVREDDIDKIKEDVSLFFFDQYQSSVYQVIKSYYTVALYFLTENINLSIRIVISDLFHEAKSSLDNYINRGATLLMIYQTCYFVIGIIFCVLLIILIKKADKRMYQIIILMFLDKGAKYKNNLRNNADNHFMKQKISLFVELVKSFNEANKKALKDFKLRSMIKGEFVSQQTLANQNEDNPLTNHTSVTNTTGNSVSLTNAQLTSTNNMLSSSHSIIKVKMSEGARALEGSKGRIRKIMTNKTEGVSASTFAKILLRERLCTISLVNLIVVIFYLLLCILFYFMLIYNSINFRNFIDHAQVAFNTLTTYFSYLTIFFNSIRMYMINKKVIPSDFINSISFAVNAEESIISLINKHSLSQLPNVNLLVRIFSRPFDETYSNFTGLCYFQDGCYKLLSKENGYCSKGLILGYKLIIQKFLEISNDFNGFLEDNPDFTSDQFKEFLIENDFTLVQENVDFVFVDVQTTLYQTFFIDYEKVKLDLNFDCIILYIVVFGVELTMILFLMIWMMYSLDKRVFQSLLGSVLFNYSFYKNVNEDKNE